MDLSNLFSFFPWFPSLSRENHQETIKPNTLLEAAKTLAQNPEETMKPPKEETVLNLTIDVECCYKVQFKGLMCEEIVGVRVWGIGVAIYDPKRDRPIFRVRKPLENVGNGMSKRGADTLASIEGLNVALDLGLKKVTFLCHDFILYQYVTGRQKSRQSKIAMLVSEVALLQSKCAYCHPSLVARNNSTFAFKLARDAIASQITLPAGSSNVFKESCVICFEETDVDQMFPVDGCLHRFCFSCMKHHVEAKLLDGMVVNCPPEGCESEVHIDSCRIFLPRKLIEIMSQRMKESSIPVTEKVYCPYPRCSALMSRSDLLVSGKLFACDEQFGARKCKKCHHIFCFKCKVPWHNNMSCYDYKRSNPYFLSGDAMLKELAKIKLWRQCVQCKNMVELAEGCFHITCRCGYEFCYTCGSKRSNNKATCSCPAWDERYIILNEQ